ncbi:MAG TPA: hydroxyisourate hydrolase [Jatrophihabitans sp.]
MSVSTHVLDAELGRPAIGVPVVLERRVIDGEDDTGWVELARATTDVDGRAAPLASDTPDGTYRISFDIAAYAGPEAFYPEATVVFRVSGGGHFHIPLLLSPFAYSTYRGS